MPKESIIKKIFYSQLSPKFSVLIFCLMTAFVLSFMLYPDGLTPPSHFIEINEQNARTFILRIYALQTTYYKVNNQFTDSFEVLCKGDSLDNFFVKANTAEYYGYNFTSKVIGNTLAI